MATLFRAPARERDRITLVGSRETWEQVRRGLPAAWHPLLETMFQQDGPAYRLSVDAKQAATIEAVARATPSEDRHDGK